MKSRSSYIILLAAVAIAQSILPCMGATASYNGKSSARNTDMYEEIWLTVNHYPDGDGPEGIACNGVPFRRGILMDAANIRLLDEEKEVPIAVKVLAYWPDGSIRAILIQFNADTMERTKKYKLEIGVQRTKPDVELTSVTWDLPKRIITLQADYLCDSLITWEQIPLGRSDFPKWERKQLEYYYRIKDVGTDIWAGKDQYYDCIHTTYQMYTRTGEIEYLINGRKWALHHRRDQIYLDGYRIGHPKGSGWTKTRYTYIEGLVDDYFFWGDEESKRVSGLIADSFYMKHEDRWYYKAPGERGHWTEREPAFALLGLVTHFEATNNPKYLRAAKHRIDLLHKMQVDNGGTAWIHNLYDHDSSEGCGVDDWGCSPWMSGLLLEGIIKFHKLTGDHNAAISIFMALEYLKENCLAKTGKHAGRSFVYLGCPKYTDGIPDLDNLISHAYAYGYKLSGHSIEDYLIIARNLLNTSLDFGGIYSAKHFNQQFRTSGHTVFHLMESIR